MYVVDHYVSSEGEIRPLWYMCPTRGWMLRYEIRIERGIIKVYHYNRGPAHSPSVVFMSKYTETIKEELKECLEIYTQTGTLNLISSTPEDY